MKRIAFIFYYIGINLFRIIPFFILYGFAYFIFLILFYLIGYRKTVVINNLRTAFPNKSDKEIKQITKQFYKNNLSAIFMESIKGFTMSKKQLQKRYVVTNPEILHDYYTQGQDVIALASHYGNWEWGIQAVDSQIEHDAAALYKPMSNKIIERYTTKLRSKSGMTLVPITKTREFFESEKDKPVLYIMAADQNPSNVKKAYWVNFFNRKTSCLHGPENYARFNNLPLVFFDVKRIKRGYYSMTIKHICKEPNSLPKGEITQKYMTLLEEAIIKSPSNWLWSHKRWKHNYQDFLNHKYDV